MRRMFERRTKARLSLSGLNNFGDLRKLVIRNIARYSAANVPFPAFFPPTFTCSILSAMFTGACGPPEKLSLALVPRLCVLRMIIKLTYSVVERSYVALLIQFTVAAVVHVAVDAVTCCSCRCVDVLCGLVSFVFVSFCCCSCCLVVVAVYICC